MKTSFPIQLISMNKAILFFLILFVSSFLFAKNNNAKEETAPRKKLAVKQRKPTRADKEETLRRET